MGNYISCFRADAPITRVPRSQYSNNNSTEYDDDQLYYGTEAMTIGGEGTDVEFESLLNSQNDFPSTRLGSGGGPPNKRSFSFLSGSPFGTTSGGPSLNRGNSFLGLSKPNISLEDDPYIEGNFESAFLNEDEDDEDVHVELMKDDQIQRISNLVDQQIKLNQVTNELQNIEDFGTELSDKPSHNNFTEEEAS